MLPNNQSPQSFAETLESTWKDKLIFRYLPLLDMLLLPNPNNHYSHEHFLNDIHALNSFLHNTLYMITYDRFARVFNVLSRRSTALPQPQELFNQNLEPNIATSPNSIAIQETLYAFLTDARRASHRIQYIINMCLQSSNSHPLQLEQQQQQQQQQKQQQPLPQPPQPLNYTPNILPNKPCIPQQEVPQNYALSQPTLPKQSVQSAQPPFMEYPNINATYTQNQPMKSQNYIDQSTLVEKQMPQQGIPQQMRQSSSQPMQTPCQGQQYVGPQVPYAAHSTPALEDQEPTYYQAATNEQQHPQQNMYSLESSQRSNPVTRSSPHTALLFPVIQNDIKPIPQSLVADVPEPLHASTSLLSSSSYHQPAPSNRSRTNHNINKQPHSTMVPSQYQPQQTIQHQAQQSGSINYGDSSSNEIYQQDSTVNQSNPIYSRTSQITPTYQTSPHPSQFRFDSSHHSLNSSRGPAHPAAQSLNTSYHRSSLNGSMYNLNSSNSSISHSQPHHQQQQALPSPSKQIQNRNTLPLSSESNLMNSYSNHQNSPSALKLSIHAPQTTATYPNHPAYPSPNSKNLTHQSHQQHNQSINSTSSVTYQPQPQPPQSYPQQSQQMPQLRSQVPIMNENQIQGNTQFKPTAPAATFECPAPVEIPREIPFQPIQQQLNTTQPIPQNNRDTNYDHQTHENYFYEQPQYQPMSKQVLCWDASAPQLTGEDHQQFNYSAPQEHMPQQFLNDSSSSSTNSSHKQQSQQQQNYFGSSYSSHSTSVTASNLPQGYSDQFDYHHYPQQQQQKQLQQPLQQQQQQQQQQLNQPYPEQPVDQECIDPSFESRQYQQRQQHQQYHSEQPPQTMPPQQTEKSTSQQSSNQYYSQQIYAVQPPKQQTEIQSQTYQQLPSINNSNTQTQQQLSHNPSGYLQYSQPYQNQSNLQPSLELIPTDPQIVQTIQQQTSNAPAQSESTQVVRKWTPNYSLMSQDEDLLIIKDVFSRSPQFDLDTQRLITNDVQKFKQNNQNLTIKAHKQECPDQGLLLEIKDKKRKDFEVLILRVIPNKESPYDILSCKNYQKLNKRKLPKTPSLMSVIKYWWRFEFQSVDQEKRNVSNISSSNTLNNIATSSTSLTQQQPQQQMPSNRAAKCQVQ